MFTNRPEYIREGLRLMFREGKTKGIGKKVILDDERELREFATRSIQAIKNIKKGEILRFEENFSILRSGKRKRGLGARYLYEVNGITAITNIEKGEGIIEYE